MCESLADIVARCGGALETGASVETVEYPLPAEASRELCEFWATEARMEMPPRFIARLPGGRVFGAGIVLSPDGKSIARDVSLDFGKPFERHWLLRGANLPPPKLVRGRTAVVASALSKGYGHWLLDELPRLLSLRRDEADRVIAHGAPSFAALALARRGWTGAVLEAERTAHFQCDELVVPSLAGTVVWPTRSGIDLVAAFAASLPPEQSTFGERVYVTRENARRRNVVNERELWAELESAGFAKVRLEALSWPEQIAAFRGAKIVVAPHGAGLANVIFCAPATRVVECFNRSYVHGCFWRLAALCGLDYRPVVAAGAEPLGQATAANRRDICVDLAQVRAAIR